MTDEVELWDVSNGTVKTLKVGNKLISLKKPVLSSRIQSIIDAIKTVQEYIGEKRPAIEKSINKPAPNTQPIVSKRKPKSGISPIALLLIIKNRFSSIPFEIKDVLNDPAVTASHSNVRNALITLTKSGELFRKRYENKHGRPVEYSLKPFNDDKEELKP